MNDDQPPYRLDIEGLDEDTSLAGTGPRAWLGIHFECCGVYARVYRDREGSMYHGRCPRCLRTVRFRVGSSGTSSRFFRAK